MRLALGGAGTHLRLSCAELTVPHLRELGERHSQRVDHAQEVEEPDVRLAALDRADVVPVCAGAMPQRLLAQPVARTQLQHRAAEGKEGIFVCGESRAAHEAY